MSATDENDLLQQMECAKRILEDEKPGMDEMIARLLETKVSDATAMVYFTFITDILQTSQGPLELLESTNKKLMDGMANYTRIQLHDDETDYTDQDMT